MKGKTNKKSNKMNVLHKNLKIKYKEDKKVVNMKVTCF